MISEKRLGFFKDQILSVSCQGGRHTSLKKILETLARSDQRSEADLETWNMNMNMNGTWKRHIAQRVVHFS